MHFSATYLTAILTAVPLIYGHNEFVRIAHNGVWQPPLKYIRNRTSPWKEADLENPKRDGWRQWTFPTYPYDAATSVRCGRDSLSWAPQTDTLKVKAGDVIEFLVIRDMVPSALENKTVVQWDGCPNGKGGCIPDGSPYKGYEDYMFKIVHEGPASIFLSRVPDDQDITTYDGSGNWIKIFTFGVEFLLKGIQMYWLPNNGARLAAKIPAQTPAGKYLIRIHQIWQGANVNAPPQIYPACAHIEVESEFSGQLPIGVKIPESLCIDCPGMMYEFDDNKPQWIDVMNGTEYAGGPIWDGKTLKEDRVVPVFRDEA